MPEIKLNFLKETHPGLFARLKDHEIPENVNFQLSRAESRDTNLYYNDIVLHSLKNPQNDESAPVDISMFVNFAKTAKALFVTTHDRLKLLNQKLLPLE